jgi:hypothetical protein
MPTVELDEETIDRLDLLQRDDGSSDEPVDELVNASETREVTLFHGCGEVRTHGHTDRHDQLNLILTRSTGRRSSGSAPDQLRTPLQCRVTGQRGSRSGGR